MAQVVARRAVSISWEGWVGIYGLFVSGRFCGWEVGKWPFSRRYSGPRTQRGPRRKEVLPEGMARRAVSLCWGCWVGTNDGTFVSQVNSGGGRWVGVSHPKRPFSRHYSGSRSQRGPWGYLDVTQGITMRVVTTCLGCWVDLTKADRGQGRGTRRRCTAIRPCRVHIG